MTRRRLEKKDRKKEILAAAMRVAQDAGYYHVTREEIATRANVSPGLVTNYFGTLKKIKRAIMREAIQQRVVSIVASGLAAKDSQAIKAPLDLREEAAQLIINI